MRKYLIIVIFFCAVATVCHAEERWALLVGIDEYSSDIITPLKGAVSDAMALRDMLVKYAGFPSDNIFCLTSDNRASLPNLGNIVTKLDYIASKAKPGDVFLFFFAGHGVVLNEQNYLLAYESDIRPLLLPKTGLSVEELSDYLAKIQSGNTILLLDACRNSPNAGRGDEDNRMTESFAKSVSSMKFSATIYACDTGQRAYEYPGRKRGFFSIALEEALSGKADEDDYGRKDGKVTLKEVGAYLAGEVPDMVNRELGMDRTQTPRVDVSGDPRAGDMVLSWTAAEQENTETVSSPHDEITASREITPRQTADVPSEMDWRQLDSESNVEETPEPGLKPLTQQEKAEGWVDATGECYGEDISPAEGQRSALERARRSAIETALEAEMPSRRALIRSVQDFHRAFIVLSQYVGYGMIVEEKDPVWTSDEKIQTHTGQPPVPLYRVALRTRISHGKSQQDPAFSVSLRLNNSTFLDGEEMILSITPTQDCYITVFNVLSDHTVLVLDTSQEQELMMAPGKQTTFLPSEAERQQGRNLRVALPEGRTGEMESVIVIATKDDIPFLPGKVKGTQRDVAATGEKAVVEILPTYQAALAEINGWLVGIPLEKRALDIQQYTIERQR